MSNNEVKNEENGERVFSPSEELSVCLSEAFDYLNGKLFGGTLPKAMVMFTRNSRIVGGYFVPNSWRNEDGVTVHEISINANNMAEGDEVLLYSILVHEMTHLWQHVYGNPGRGGYHNQEWADFAKTIGLKPSSANDPETETGDSVSTTLIEGGPAMLAIASMPESISIPWYAVSMADPEGDPGRRARPKPGGKAKDGVPAPRGGRRTKYTCPQCGANLWGKPALAVMCIPCSKQFVEMVDK